MRRYLAALAAASFVVFGFASTAQADPPCFECGPPGPPIPGWTLPPISGSTTTTVETTSTTEAPETTTTLPTEEPDPEPVVTTTSVLGADRVARVCADIGQAITVGDPNYGSDIDADGDGVACESYAKAPAPVAVIVTPNFTG